MKILEKKYIFFWETFIFLIQVYIYIYIKHVVFISKIFLKKKLKAIQINIHKDFNKLILKKKNISLQ